MQPVRSLSHTLCSGIHPTDPLRHADPRARPAPLPPSLHSRIMSTHIPTTFTLNNGVTIPAIGLG